MRFSGIFMFSWRLIDEPDFIDVPLGPSIQRWNISTGEKVAEFQPHRHLVSALARTEIGEGHFPALKTATLTATASAESELTIWDDNWCPLAHVTWPVPKVMTTVLSWAPLPSPSSSRLLLSRGTDMAHTTDGELILWQLSESSDSDSLLPCVLEPVAKWSGSWWAADWVDATKFVAVHHIPYSTAPNTEAIVHIFSHDDHSTPKTPLRDSRTPPLPSWVAAHPAMEANQASRAALVARARALEASAAATQAASRMGLPLYHQRGAMEGIGPVYGLLSQEVAEDPTHGGWEEAGVVRLPVGTSVSSLASGPGYIALAQSNREVRILCSESLKTLAVVGTGCSRPIRCMALRPLPPGETGMLLALARRDSEVQVIQVTWDKEYEPERPLRSIDGVDEAPPVVVDHPTAISSSTITRLGFSPAPPAEIRQIRFARSVQVDLDAEEVQLWVANESSLCRVNVVGTETDVDNELHSHVAWHELAVSCGGWSPSGNQVASGDLAGHVYAWAVSPEAHEDGQPAPFGFHQPVWHVQGPMVRSLVYSPCGTYVYYGDMEGVLWKVGPVPETPPNSKAGTSQLLPERLGSFGDGNITCLRWKPDSDGRLLALSTTEGRIVIWDVSKGLAVSDKKLHTCEVWSMAWSPDGTELATGSEDRTTVLWDVKTWERTGVYAGHSMAVTCVDWAETPIGPILATSSDDLTVRTWKVPSRASGAHRSLDTWAVFRTVDRYIAYMALEPNGGTRLAAASATGTVYLFDVVSKKFVTRQMLHAGSVEALAWNPATHSLFSASSRCDLAVYRAPSLTNL